MIENRKRRIADGGLREIKKAVDVRGVVKIFPGPPGGSCPGVAPTFVAVVRAIVVNNLGGDEHEHHPPERPGELGQMFVADLVAHERAVIFDSIMKAA
jgi:hypothetical protein